MTKELNPVQIEYEGAVKKLLKFCEEHSDLTPIIIDSEYPIQVQFFPEPQQSFFGNENIDENGEINHLTVAIGLSTTVKSTLKFKMDSKLLKKLIKLAETVGRLYYHAFRAEQGERLTPRRPVMLEMTSDPESTHRCCPNCERPVSIWALNNTEPAFCQGCGQALDLTLEPEQQEAES